VPNSDIDNFIIYKGTRQAGKKCKGNFSLELADISPQNIKKREKVSKNDNTNNKKFKLDRQALPKSFAVASPPQQIKKK
jgi:hypothetical protein